MVDDRQSYAFVISWPIQTVGGVNEVVRNLLEEFHAAGEYRPVLIENDWSSTHPVVVRRPEYTHIRLRLISLWPLGRTGAKASLMFALSLPWTLWTLRRLSVEFRIAAFNIHFPELDALRWVALRALRLFSGKVVLSFHGTDIRTALGLRGWSRWCYRLLLRRADAIVSCSAGLAREIRALEPRIKCAVIHNGIDASRFAHEGTVSDRPAPLPKGERVLCIGKFQYGKAHDLLLRAFSDLLVTHPLAHLILVGATGPELSNTRRAIHEANLDSHVTVECDLPHPAIPGLLSSSRLLVLCSRWVPGKLGEGFPMVILEAGAMGTPVVATRTCGADEIIEDGVTGRLVPLEDCDALSRAMGEVLEDRAAAESMAENLANRRSRQVRLLRAD
jgi:L-malate glycosyltransferase